MNIAIILLSVGIATFGHAFLKKGAMTLSLRSESPDAFAVLEIVRNIALNPYIVSGIFCHVLALGVWIIALKRSEISFALPFQALGYVAMLLLARVWFGETITTTKLLGIGIIVLGVIVLSRN